MKWLDNWIYRCVNRARHLDEVECIPEPVNGRGARTLSGNRRVASNYDDENVISFTLYGASGGKIIEAVGYDKKNDRERVHRYVIADDSDIADTLAKIVTMENLR